MYELQESERKNKWEQYNKAVKLMEENQEGEEAMSLLKQFEIKHPNDLPTQFLLKKCKKLLK